MPVINTADSHELTKLRFPSIKTVPDVGNIDTVKAFPQVFIEYFLQ